MGTETAVTAGATARARRRVISYFTERGAVSAANAIAFEPDGRLQRRWFSSMRDHGLIVAATGDRYWIDPVRLEAWRHQRRKRVGIGIAVLLVAIVAGAGIGLLA